MTRGPSIDAFLARVQDTSASAVVPVVRQYLGDVRAFLRELQASGAGGAVVNETHSDLIDRLVRRLFEFAEEAYFASGAEADTDLCVVAVGGYARREMSIHSDVDLLFLYRESLTPYVASVAERVQQWLWDAALTVGGATRTIAETVSLAREDSDGPDGGAGAALPGRQRGALPRADGDAARQGLRATPRASSRTSCAASPSATRASAIRSTCSSRI